LLEVGDVAQHCLGAVLCFSADKHPQVVSELTGAYDKFWESLRKRPMLGPSPGGCR